jgi:hypothetical protein
MVLNLVRNQGVPALAYAVNDVSVLWPCSLKILHSDAQFVVSLGHSISIHGHDDEQLFTLRYEGDNLMPGKASLGSVGISLSDGLLQNIARHGQPRPRTLSLTLKAPCSVWYPHNLGNGVSSLQTRFHDFSIMAKATEVHILFDINWLGKNNLAQLQSVVEGSRQLTGIPVIAQFARSYQQADWSILNFQDAKFEAYVPNEDEASEAVPSIEDALHDAPPPYVHVSSKRPRSSRFPSWLQYRHIANVCFLARTSLTPDSPLPKRLLQDTTCVPSPTERATSAVSPGSKSTASSTATVQVDVFQDIVTSAVEKVLPEMLRAQLPSILQDLLPGLLAGPSPSPSSSPTPRSSQIANAPIKHQPASSHKPTPAAVFRAVISTHTQTHLQRILTDALDQAHDQATELHDSAGVEFDEYLADTRLDFATLKEEHIAAFNEDCNEKLEEFKERLVEEKEEAEEEVEEHAEKMVLMARDKLNMEVWCRCKSHHCAREKKNEVEQGRRAMSLPL